MKEAMAKCKAKKKMKLIILLFLIIQKEMSKFWREKIVFLLKKSCYYRNKKVLGKK
jgi:hypothetical protein